MKKDTRVALTAAGSVAVLIIGGITGGSIALHKLDGDDNPAAKIVVRTQDNRTIEVDCSGGCYTHRSEDEFVVIPWKVQIEPGETALELQRAIDAQACAYARGCAVSPIDYRQQINLEPSADAEIGGNQYLGGIEADTVRGDMSPGVALDPRQELETPEFTPAPHTEPCSFNPKYTCVK
jgi:hypothetical protein